MKNLSRRNLLKLSGTAALGLGTLPLTAQESAAAPKKLKILIIGAHPDDPETACGGIMSLYATEGHEVVSVYLTRGEAGIPGKSYPEAADIRTKEALEACKIMKSRAVFLKQIDGNCEITTSRYAEMLQFIQSEKPDKVFTHWPVDSHRDHRVCSILVFDAWQQMNKSFELYYFEVESGGQTQNFAPNMFVNITSVIEQKHAACNCHVSQDMKEVYREYHAHMEKFRGLQAQCQYAEAFIRHDQTNIKLP